MVQILEAGNSVTVSDNKKECTMQFKNEATRKAAASFLREYRDRLTHVNQDECQKRIGQCLAVFSGKEV